MSHKTIPKFMNWEEKLVDDGGIHRDGIKDGGGENNHNAIIEREIAVQ